MNFLQLKHPLIIRTEVNTDLQSLAQVLTWFEQSRPATVPHSVWLECQIALAEGFTNAVRHAHRGKSIETPIEIEIALQPQSIELRVWDCGAGFDLETRLHDLPEAAPESAGGRGLKIIQQIADRFSYTAVDRQRNCLLVVKRYRV